MPLLPMLFTCGYSSNLSNTEVRGSSLLPHTRNDVDLRVTLLENGLLICPRHLGAKTARPKVVARGAADVTERRRREFATAAAAMLVMLLLRLKAMERGKWFVDNKGQRSGIK